MSMFDATEDEARRFYGLMLVKADNAREDHTASSFQRVGWTQVHSMLTEHAPKDNRTDCVSPECAAWPCKTVRTAVGMAQNPGFWQ
ncbi:hypothetical protein ACFVWN_01225 [Nocardiopsis flavescens]|uniref:hypothetical protein n=1 Tax=Nocardiopsis flavescens TaxID=758803 RepID=UPI0036581878